MTRFTPWYAAAAIPSEAPAEPGMFQVRTAELLVYPCGRSAMVHYAAAADLRAAMQAWAQAHAEHAGLRFRHCAELGAQTPAQFLAKLEGRFIERFGCAPALSPRAAALRGLEHE